MKKETNEEKKQWLELCNWLEINIFNYNIPYQRLQKESTLILRGLKYGQRIANNNCEKHGNYPSNVILMAFKANKIKILNAIKDKKFENESNKMRYVCSIIRDDIDDIYNRYLKIKDK